MAQYDYDLFVIGGGSGGVRAARVSAALGKRVGLAEEYRFGGTCVIRGCVPKKLFVYAAQFAEQFEDAAGFGWALPSPTFDWKMLVSNKDREIERLEGLYQNGVRNAGGDTIRSRAVLVNRNTLLLEDEQRTVTADQILVATGGKPTLPVNLPGIEHCITSNEVFDLPALPNAIVIAGGGYIAVEFANIFHGLGAKVTLVYRGKEILRRFDHDLRQSLHASMETKGIRIITEATIERVARPSGAEIKVDLSTGEELTSDQVMMCIGREPNTQGLGLEKAGVEVGPFGEVLVDEFSRTSAPNIWAVGYVTDRVQLTPAAIHEAMCLVETLWKNNPTRPDLDLVPTAVFSQPEIGTVGLSEEAAGAQFQDIDIYRAQFRPMRNTLGSRSERMLMKLVVDAKTDVVLGAHILGADAGELVQLLGITLKAGMRKLEFDRTMAVHPTAAEELVTMYSPTYRIRNGVRVEN